jgi:predicted GH43/DUF377 family glycosyl hydrolase
MKLTRCADNPILVPKPENYWEARAVFNCGAVCHSGLVHLIYRAVDPVLRSSLGYAVSEDGVHFKRLDRPVLGREGQLETRGAEDPRITPLENRFYMLYTAYSRHGTRVSLASSTNLIAWRRHGVVLPREDNKDAALFSRRIGGRYAMLHRRPPDIWIAFSSDLLHWTDHQIIMRPEQAWEANKIGAAGPPVRTDRGWLLFYHGVDEGWAYRLGVALLDGEDPTHVVARQGEPILEPEDPWEQKGDVPHVVFSCGAVEWEDSYNLYYGAADSVICLATVSQTEALDFV